MGLTPGSRLGPYEIVSAAGAGGMGEVYKARDSRLGRTVALKILPADLAADARHRLRFEREAKAISSLNHPHICTLHDLGRDGEIDYLVMEYCDGDTLADRIATGPLPVASIVQYGMQIADALARAHRQHIIHRDLKPSNVMVTKSGVKVLDFGLARVHLSSEPQPEGSTAVRELTGEGHVPGTTGYMAPELFHGAAADERSDVFALGVVLYEMSTGRRAFQATDWPGLIAAVLERDPRPVSELNAAVPPELERLIGLCLVKDPEERIQSAHDVLLALRSVGIEPRPRVPRRERRTLAAIAAAIVLTALAATWVAGRLGPRAAPSSPRKLAIALPPELPLGSYARDAFAVSPDGKSIAFGAVVDQKLALHLITLADGSVRRLATGDSADNPFFSPDGRSIGYFDQATKKVKRVEIASGDRIEVCDAPNLRGATWSPDGSTIVFSPDLAAPLFHVPAVGGKAEPLTTLRNGETAHRTPHFLPDGRHVVFTARGPAAGNDANDHLAVVSLDTRKVTDIRVLGFHARFSNGYLFFTTRRGLFAVPFDTRRLETTGPTIPLGANVRREAFGSFALFEITPNGSLLYAPQHAPVPADLVRVDRGSVRTISKKSARFGAPDVSPDGRHVLVEVYRGEYRYDLWRCSMESGSCSALTAEANGDGGLWSKDQQQIAYSCPGRTTRTVCIMSSDGGPPLRRQTAEWAWPQILDWSRDGRFVLFSVQSARTQWDIWRWDLQKGDGPDALFPVVATPDNHPRGTLSPDSRWLIYDAEEDAASRLYATTFPDARRTVRLGVDGTHPMWSSDGKRIFYVDDDRLMVAAVSADSDISLAEPRMLYDELVDFVEIAMVPGSESFVAIRKIPTPPEPNNLTLEEGLIAALRAGTNE